MIQHKILKPLHILEKSHKTRNSPRVRVGYLIYHTFNELSIVCGG